MQIATCTTGRVRIVSLGLVLVWLAVIGIASCGGPARRDRLRFRKSEVGWPKGVARWQESKYPAVKVDSPQVAGAELVNDDSLCATCHEVYVKKFESNVHRQQKCEGCHGPASKHVASRGEAGTILSFKTLAAAQRSEICLKCHEKPHEPGERWRTSAHANHGLSCTDCHRGHYNVPAGTPSTELAGSSNPHSGNELKPADDMVSYILTSSGSQRPNADSQDVDLLAIPALQPSRDSSGVVNGSKFVIRAQEPSDSAAPISLKGTSNNLGAIAPQVCYKCHTGMRDLEAVAHPHQVCGRNGFNCTTCHDTHGNIRMETRKDVCLECHKGAPTMAWHSSTHEQYGVACTDCHNPHPRSNVPAIANIGHTSVDRPKRLPMSVEQPDACYRCHPQIFAKNSMPSHHPIKEGKMVCSDCHDGHGQSHGNLREGATVNMVCYRCHAEKQGPFAYEHPPVTENCAICHEAHGTVANNLLRQPASFLCLRCHTGHRTSPLGPDHANLLGDVGTSPTLQRAFYTDCTQCHSQIHGSDLPTPHVPHGFMR